MTSKTATKTFSLLSIGQRGVGKTVFLAGSYAEFNSNRQIDRSQQLWFDCQDSQAQKNIGDVLSYIARTGQYPPMTMKVTDFNFSLKRHSLWSTQTLCDFRWWDIPGEICDLHNSDFKAMVLASHGCCVFIDAYALVHKPAYQQALEEIIQQVMPIASLVYLNGLKYAFALILTKCDLLEPDLLGQQLEEGLRRLTAHLDQVKVNYKTFYSLVPIVNTEGASALKATGAAAPLLWLVWELSKAHNPKLKNNLLRWVTHLLPNHLQPQPDSVNGLVQNLHRTTGRASGVKKELGLYLLPSDRKLPWLLISAIIGTLGVISLLLVDYKWFFQPEPNNLDALSETEPEHLKSRLQQAQSYEAVGQLAKAEALYDQVLAEQSNNFNALVSKAVLRHAQGDAQMAETLFAQAEKAAPNDLKAQVREVARKTLQTPAKSD